MNKKVKYLIDSFQRYFSDKSCPSCSNNDVKLIQRKFLLTRLYKCTNCNLMFRHPKDTILSNKKFYQEEYDQDGGITTNLPDSNELDDLINSNFKGTDKNISEFVKIFKALSLDHETLKVTDYGASWGYMSYQFLKHGYNVDSFEISKSRATFGNDKLKLNIKTNEDELKTEQDIFFSSHVIEHVPVIANMVSLSERLLKKGGYFIAECPNGSMAFKKKNEDNFLRAWGLVHPNLLSDEFYSEVFKSNPFIILSTPYDDKTLNQICEWNQKDQLILDVSGPQIMVIAKLN